MKMTEAIIERLKFEIEKGREAEMHHAQKGNYIEAYKLRCQDKGISIAITIVEEISQLAIEEEEEDDGTTS